MTKRKIKKKIYWLREREREKTERRETEIQRQRETIRRQR